MRSVIVSVCAATFAFAVSMSISGCPDTGPTAVVDSSDDIGSDTAGLDGKTGDVLADVFVPDTTGPADATAEADLSEVTDDAQVDTGEVSASDVAVDTVEVDANNDGMSLDTGADSDTAPDVSPDTEVNADTGDDVDVDNDAEADGSTDVLDDVMPDIEDDTGPDTVDADMVDTGVVDVVEVMDSDAAIDAAEDTVQDTAEDVIEDAVEDVDAAADMADDLAQDVAEDVAADVPLDTDAGESCPGLEPMPFAYETLTDFSTSEDFAISDAGDYYANEGPHLVRRIGGTGPLELFVPGIGVTAGMGFLPGGDLVVADVGSGSLIRIAPNGSQTTILSGLEYPNGLDIHWDGRVFIAEQSGHRVRAVDPDTGAFEIVAEGICSPNGVSFGPGYERVYVGSFGCGYVYAIDEDPAGGWSDPLVIGANGVAAPGAQNVPGIGSGGLDGLNTDVCGNIYVTDFGPGNIYRIPPDLGPPTIAVTLPSVWIPNLHWGNGVGIWDPYTLYVADRDQGRLFALDIGVLGKETTAP